MWLSLPFLQKAQDFLHVWTILTKIKEILCTTHATVIAFMVRDVMELNGIFSIFRLAGLIKLMVYLQICH